MKVKSMSLLGSVLIALGVLGFTGGMIAQDKPPAKKTALNPNAKPFVPKVQSEDEDGPEEAEETEVPIKEQEVPLEKKLEGFTEKSFIAKHVATTQQQAFDITKTRKWPSGATSQFNTVIKLDEHSLEVLTKAHSHEIKYVCAVDLPAWECAKGGKAATSCTFNENTLIGIQYHTKKSAKAIGANPDFMYHVRKPDNTKMCSLN